METITVGLVAFLRARLNEDEQVALAAPHGAPLDGQWVVDTGPTGQERIRTRNGWSLAYGHSNSLSGKFLGRLGAYETALRFLARPYPGHPDYDPAWGEQ